MVHQYFMEEAINYDYATEGDRSEEKTQRSMFWGNLGLGIVRLVQTWFGVILKCCLFRHHLELWDFPLIFGNADLYVYMDRTIHIFLEC